MIAADHDDRTARRARELPALLKLLWIGAIIGGEVGEVLRIAVEERDIAKLERLRQAAGSLIRFERWRTGEGLGSERRCRCEARDEQDDYASHVELRRKGQRVGAAHLQIIAPDRSGRARLAHSIKTTGTSLATICAKRAASQLVNLMQPWLSVRPI